MKQIAYVMAACVIIATLAGCNNKNGPSASEDASSTAASPTMLSDISGVWRASDGTMISIVYEDKKLRLLFGSDAIPVQVGAIDEQNHTTNLKVTLPDGKPGIWTVSQIFDPSNKESFTLQLTLHDGTQDQLSFVRKISNDDLNVIAAAESKVHAGSISEAVDQSAAQPPGIVSTQATAEQPADPYDAAATAEPTESDPTSWAPSFDCAKASTGPERLICSSKELSAADVSLAQAYRAAKDASDDKARLSQQQSTWRKNVRDACSDVSCMLNAYQQRIAELN
ncbi:MAG TPA: lysozyme inhibitor LprI family protein [Xanthomonadaceae bacterium]|nr:lysozyme inhibitor LprI family protein [Xanthomonadaceae bacterium]